MPFSVQVMLLGFVLLGRSLEEKARIRASSDMNELLVSSNHFYIYYCKKQLGCLIPMSNSILVHPGELFI